MGVEPDDESIATLGEVEEPQGEPVADGFGEQQRTARVGDPLDGVQAPPAPRGLRQRSAGVVVGQNDRLAGEWRIDSHATSLGSAS